MAVRALLLATSLALLAPALAQTASPDPSTETYDSPTPLTASPGDAQRGATVFVARAQGHCVLCHAVEGLNAPFQGNVGPPLTSVGDRLSAGEIRYRLVDITRLNPDTVMPSYYRTHGLTDVAAPFQGQTVLTAQDIEDLIAYLGTLKDRP